MPGSEGKYYFCLEPYVHIARGRNGVLFYNSLSGVATEFRNTESIIKITDQWLNPENGYAAEIYENQVRINSRAGKMLQVLRDNFMGDIWRPEWSGTRPFNLYPMAAIQNMIPGETEAPARTVDPDKLKHFLREIIFCLNSGPDDEEPWMQSSFFQFHFPSPASNERREMDLQLVMNALHPIGTVNMPQLTFTGKDLQNHYAFEELLHYLSRIQTSKRFFLDLRKTNPGTLERIIRVKNSKIVLFDYPPFSAGSPGKRALLTLNKGNRIEVRFILRHANDYSDAWQIVSQEKIKNYTFLPVLTGDNLSFFQEYVFIRKEEILAVKPGLRQVLSRLTLNELDFGILSVSPDGNVFSGGDGISIGNIGNSPVSDLVFHEMNSGCNWFRTRVNAEPCRECLYRFLCPPVSRYETVYGRYNFCDVNPLIPGRNVS